MDAFYQNYVLMQPHILLGVRQEEHKKQPNETWRDTHHVNKGAAESRLYCALSQNLRLLPLPLVQFSHLNSTVKNWKFLFSPACYDSFNHMWLFTQTY